MVTKTLVNEIRGKWLDNAKHHGIKTPHEAVSLALHYFILSQGCQLIGISEQNVSDEAKTCELPETWNASDNVISFVYRRKDGRAVVIKNVILGGTLHVNAVLHQEEKVYMVQLDVDTYVANTDDESSNNMHLKNLSGMLDKVGSSVVQSLFPPLTSELPTRIPFTPFPPQREIFPDARHPFDPRGDFDGDLFPHGPLRPSRGGNLMGPYDPLFNPRGRGRGRRGAPRFDPFGPGRTGTE